jgi:hypothetical protein
LYRRACRLNRCVADTPTSGSDRRVGGSSPPPETKQQGYATTYDGAQTNLINMISEKFRSDVLNVTSLIRFRMEVNGQTIEGVADVSADGYGCVHEESVRFLQRMDAYTLDELQAIREHALENIVLPVVPSEDCIS